MEKCVGFYFLENGFIFYDVDNFDLETIRSLPSYNGKWLTMIFLNVNQEEAKSYDDFFDYPTDIIEKTVYYGKKISYADVKRIVGNDKKYNCLLKSMKLNASIEVKSSDELDDESIRQFDENHYCLFTMPINFDEWVLLDGKSLTIEEFDPEINLNYDGILKLIEANSVAGDIYIREHEEPLRLFKDFFDMLCSFCGSLSDDICRMIFECYIFNFKSFSEFESLDAINAFLDICDYIYNCSSFCDGLFKKYRVFVNEYYEDLELGEEPKF